MAKHDEDFYFNFALKLALEAGHVLKGVTFARKTVTQKLGNWDLVTEYDRKIEDIIIGKLKQQFPEHKFIGEESTGKDLPELTDDPTWIIDPIDGTTNFIHNFPQICVVIGLSINKEMRIGIVYNPVLDQLFTARKGRGSFLNGRPLKTSTVDGNDVDIMNPRAIGACNKTIVQDLRKMINNADRQVELHQN
ncbi:hypothetical protein G9C98_007577 [Cotesia typhae]|uniref:Inositol-1-monophosphatase n=1 Tax=Cotesia typhae TaxID=2053667 RepID=A0A8J5UW76_9HYME|nr:hypothetical protein G9C98_007577 [Cotesia typhae]